MGKGQELLEAAREGDKKTVEKLIAQITKRSGPFTSLRRGAGVNVQDDNGYTPLHHACLRGHKEIVRLLLSVDASPCIVDKKGANALHLAAWKGDSEVVSMLLSNNNPSVNVDQLTSDQETALLIAAQFGNVHVVAQLLARGADVTIRNIKDESPLDLAAQYGRLETVHHLLRARPQLVDPYRFPVCRGRLFSSTPLHRASKNGHKEVVSTLIAAGIDPNIRTYNGTPLHEAANYGKASVVRILLSKGADLNAADRRGKTVHDLLNEYSEEATKRVRRIIREHMATNGYESDEDLPPFPVQDYSPTGYPCAPAMKTTETHNVVSSLSPPPSSSSSILTKNHPQSFVKKLASKFNFGLKSKFNSAPNISNTSGSQESEIALKTKLGPQKSSSSIVIGNSKFFKKLSKKEDSGEIVCNDEFDTISLDRLAVLDRESVLNKSNRSCPGFKTSLPNISENPELSDSQESISISEIEEVSNSSPSLEAVNRIAKLSIFEPRDTDVNNVTNTNIVVNEYYESYSTNSQPKIPKPQPRITTVSKTNDKVSGKLYENVITRPAPPIPAVRHVTNKKTDENNVVYENVNPVSSVTNTPEPNKSNFVPVDVNNVINVDKPCLSRTSTLSTDSMIDETNLEDIFLSKKSTSFKLDKLPGYEKDTQESDSDDSLFSNYSDNTEASALDNVDVSEDKNIYLSMTGTMPHKKPEPVVKKKVLFRHKTFTNAEIDRTSVTRDIAKNKDDFLKETLANYHIRGTGHCIHKSPTVKEFIYIFNRETLYQDVPPFEKVSENKRESHFETAICFCKPKQPKFHKSAEDLLGHEEDKVFIDLDCLKKDKELLSTSFQCFCDKETCTFHAKNRESAGGLVVKFSAINKSISTPNISLESSSLEKRPLTKILSVPVLEEPYAVVSVEDIVIREKAKPSNENAYATISQPSTLSQPSTISSSSRPYSIKDISDAISTSPETSLSYQSDYNVKKSSSEYSGRWSLQTCNSNVTVKSDMSFKSCLDELSSDDETLQSDSDTDTIKSEISLNKRPWVHSDSFRFGNNNHNTTIIESSLESDKFESGIDSEGASRESDQLNVSIESQSHDDFSDNAIDSNSSDEKNNNVSKVNGKNIIIMSEVSEIDNTVVVKDNLTDDVKDAPVCASLEPGVGDNVHSGSRRRWEEGEGTSEGDALSISSAASSCAAHHIAHHLDYNKVSPTPPKKPPRRNLSVSPTHANSPSSGYSYELRMHARSQDDLDDILTAKQYLKHGRSIDQYDTKLSYSEFDENYAPRITPVPNPRPSLKNRTQPVAITTMYENVVVKEQNPKRKLRRNYPQNELKIDGLIPDRSSLESLLDSPSDCDMKEIPVSPSHYKAPPTPDHPPPSARHAENRIHETIRPLSQEYKRRSALRDSYTETDVNLLRVSSAASVASVYSDRSATTDNSVEEYVCDVPFAGLFKGSTTTLDGIGLRPMPAERPKTLRKLKPVYDLSPTDNHPTNGQDRHNGEEVRKRSDTMASQGDKSISILSPFDEQEEWAKISEIMASFGSKLVRESVFVTEIEQEFTSRLGLSCSESSLSQTCASSLGLWLASLGMQDYEAVFTDAGFDDVDFINGVLDENDLKQMSIDEQDRPKILEAMKQLPSKVNEINNNVNNKSDSVEKWLRDLNLEQYGDVFKRHLYTDMQRVKRIWDVELTAVLEIHKTGHRKRILASVCDKNGPLMLDDVGTELLSLKTSIHEKHPLENLKAIPPPTVPSNETLKRSKKSRPAPQPPKPSDFEIRAPSELLVGVPGALNTEWKHQPFVLITGAVTYVANYLGSTVVKELRGTESTKKSIQKLKKNTKDSRDTPEIILSISYRSVKFLNTITRDLVCEHEVRNIHCACQDADDLTHFAYITKDHDSKTHYCHVFRVATMEQATEVILTLGEAFEVAYQMALRDQSHRSKLKEKDRPPNHGRSNSVTELKLNGHQLKLAPLPTSLSSEDFQRDSRSPMVLKAPIASTEEL